VSKTIIVPKERSIERACVNIANKLGLYLLKISEPKGRCGIPDRLLIAPSGKYLFIEFKRPFLGRLSLPQEHQMKKLKELGCDVRVCDNVDSFIKMVRELLEK
jgi:hypothetical protein